MRFLCRIGFHAWGKWTPYGCRHVYASTKKGVYYPETRQVRRCEECGKTQDVHVADEVLPGVAIHIDNTGREKAPLGLD